MLKFDVIMGKVFGINVARGYGKLADLSRISKADVFDEVRNPTGTQRDLSPKHAREAYEYARNSELGYWPEVFLCVRNDSVVRIDRSSSIDSRNRFASLHVDESLIGSIDGISISRIDGNHRLYFGAGGEKGYEALDREVSFCLALGLSLDEEIKLFRDINNNQRKMDTSHLDKIELRLSGADRIKETNPALYIAERLANDPNSPLAPYVYQGGKRPVGTFMPLRSVHTGIEYMLSRQTKLTALGGAEPQAKVIINYFRALRLWVPEAWTNPKDYLMLRGAGFWGTCFLGADVIDRALSAGRFEAEDMLSILKSGATWDWSRNGQFQGLSGRGGAVKIADMIIRELKDENGSSMKDLLNKIMGT